MVLLQTGRFGFFASHMVRGRRDKANGKESMDQKLIKSERTGCWIVVPEPLLSVATTTVRDSSYEEPRVSETGRT